MGRKLTSEEIKSKLLNIGLILISDNDDDNYMVCKTQEGYIVRTKLNNKKSKIFSTNNPYTIENIKLWLKINNSKYTLKSTEYKGIEKHLIFVCPTHGDFKMSFHNIKAGKNCSKCSKNYRYTYEEIKNLFKKKGYELITNTYKDNKQKLTIKTKEGYIVLWNFHNFNIGQNPSVFGNNNPYTIKNIKLWLKLNNIKYTLISKDYITATNKLNFYCEKHGYFKISWADIHSGRGCYQCSIESRSGENSSSYNPTLTQEEREKGRNYEEYYKWREEIYKHDNYTCQCCGKKGGRLNAHHLNGYNWCKEERINIQNGVTLCDKCHNEFHFIYGKGNNTEEQFKQYINNKL